MKRLTRWEFFLTLPPLVLSVLLVGQRKLIYSKGEYGILNDNIAPLLVWALISVALLLASKPWNRASRYGSALRWLGVAAGCTCTAFLLLVGFSWGRYKLIRTETLTADLGITSYSPGPEADRTGDILDPDVGPYIRKDHRLAVFLVAHSGETFLSRPKAAALLYRSLSADLSAEEIMELSTGPDFLLACLVEQSRQGEGELDPDAARLVVTRFLGGLEENDLKRNECLVFLYMTQPEFFHEEEGELLLHHWAQQFEELESLAVEGLVLRRRVEEFLSEAGLGANLTVEVKASGAVPDESYMRNLDTVMERAALGLVRSTGRKVTRAGRGADLEIAIHLRQIPHHSYQSPTYDYETYYDYESMGKPVGKYMLPSTRRVKKERLVQTGHEEKTQLAPTARVTLRAGKKVLNLPEVLVFWHHLRFDYGNNRYLDLQNEQTFGRMWPFGVHKELFEEENQ